MKRYLFGVLCAAGIASFTTILIEQKRIATIRLQLAKDAVQSDWDAARFTLRPSDDRVEWSYDQGDRSEMRFISRLRRIYLVTDFDGRVLEWSNPYKQIGLPFPTSEGAEPRIWEAKGRATGFDSIRYVLCTGPLRGTKGRRYQLTVGQQLD